MERASQPCDIEYWGGIECTVNRIQDDYYDQLRFTGHYQRSGDIERIASLGVKRLRYPVLWEVHEIKPQNEINWNWISGQLTLIKAAGMDPVAGLVHHGSGPAFTNLADPDFGSHLAAYASRVAMRFPWLTWYTPVNEPLTTARFSGLYGLWYPHKRDDLAFLTMLLNQVKGIVLSMKEIRKINPEAKLLQTEDLAKTYSVPSLNYQADFENERRWLTCDLLCGKVNRTHPLWNYLIWVGISERDLAFFEEHPCVPDIAGFNYYLTSERYLDDDLESYPAHLHGGNHQHRYVDTEAIRVEHDEPYGLSLLLKEAWDRFKLPMAVTEVYLSCTQEEQVRWVYDVLEECCKAKENGVDLKAVTFWALLGEYGWNNLVTSADGEYESGAFDVRYEDHDTLLASCIRQIISSNIGKDEWLNMKGWWKSSERFHIRKSCIV